MKQVNKEKHNLLLIFTRNPELGKCKTRLAAVVGDKVALEIYRFLLQHTVKFSKNIKAQKEVYYSEEIWGNDIWDNDIFDKKLQQGLDLGERMSNAFKTGFKAGFNKIIVIGSDMYDLSTIEMDYAFEQLDTHDYVVGPAEDGGYYLLGMKTSTPNLFKNKDWGKETVLQDTLNDLTNRKVKILDIKNDVDHYGDIKDIEIFQPFLIDIKI
ncbi:MAG: glycosyltransferase [Flavobacteriaceae bacterium]|nr:MAG: glycosyltransferase [Flavobacteriaceae bacterium]